MLHQVPSRALVVDGSLTRLLLLTGDRALALWVRLALDAAFTGSTRFCRRRLQGVSRRAPRRTLDDLVDLAVLGLVTLEPAGRGQVPIVHVNTWSAGRFEDVISGVPRGAERIADVLARSQRETRASRSTETRRARDRTRKRATLDVRARVDGVRVLDALRPFSGAERTRLWKLKKAGVAPAERALLILEARGARREG